MQTYWYIKNLIYEEEHDLVKQGFTSSLVIDTSDFAFTIITAKNHEQVFYLNLRFGERLESYLIQKNDSIL
jgi:hypothetical protein